MKIAVLLTGLDTVFPMIEDRVISNFECDGIEFDFFAHTWEEKVVTVDDIDSTDWESISKYFIRKNVIFPYSNSKIKNFKSSSYNEIYEKYISLYTSDIDVKTMLAWMSYLSQNLSTHYAFMALQEYVELNNIKYDYVIKWRYDLLIENKSKFDFFKKLEDGHKIYAPYVDSRQMSDYYYYSRYNTFKRVVENLPTLISDELARVLLRRHGDVCARNIPYDMLHERMILEAFLTSLNEDNWEKSLGQAAIGVHAIFRPECDPDADFMTILNYNKHGWCAQGWEQRIIK